jgi:ribosomal protein L11 methyltransferase
MLALVLTVNSRDVELASDRLWSLGVVAVEERAGAVEGTVELWTSLGDERDTIASALNASDTTWSWRFEDVHEGVSETWRDHATATWIDDDLVVYPAWTARPDERAVTAISIEPGATFGMGDHPTTVLSLRALRRVMTTNAAVLDVGCGSGVLAIASCLFGAARADAIDISPAAVPITHDNAVRNAVVDRVHVSTTPLQQMRGSYDVVLANILAPTLIELADDLKRLLRPDGALVISGILADAHEHVLLALQPLRVVDRSDLGMWTAITLRW